MIKDIGAEVARILVGELVWMTVLQRLRFVIQKFYDKCELAEIQTREEFPLAEYNDINPLEMALIESEEVKWIRQN